MTKDTVIEIIDGDTFLTKDNGTIRLIGIDTPEIRRNTPLDNLNRVIIDTLHQLVLNKPVELEICPVRPVDDYGRTRAIVFTKKDGKKININTFLIEAGFAKLMNVRPCHIDAGRKWGEIEKKAQKKKEYKVHYFTPSISCFIFSNSLRASPVLRSFSLICIMYFSCHSIDSLADLISCLSSTIFLFMCSTTKIVRFFDNIILPHFFFSFRI